MSNRTMTPLEFLQSAENLNCAINCKLGQLESLNCLASRVTQTFSDMPHSPNRTPSSQENILVKIIDLRDEINADVDKLVDLKSDITKAINEIPNYSIREVLSNRYLCFKSWSEIAEEMHFSYKHIHTLNKKGIELLQVPKKYKI